MIELSASMSRSGSGSSNGVKGQSWSVVLRSRGLHSLKLKLFFCSRSSQGS